MDRFWTDDTWAVVRLMNPRKILSVARNIAGECTASANVVLGFRSQARLDVDIVLSRFAHFLPTFVTTQVHQIKMRNGAIFCYRINRGDLQSIREVWVDEAYRGPFMPSGGTLVDLGANIGLTSVWLVKTYSFSQVVAVEPVAANAELTRKNLALNHVHGHVVEAAIGPSDGIANFEMSQNSNQGRISASGTEVPVLGMNSVMRLCGLSEINLLKIDIEGGEQDLFMGPTDWLDRTHAIIIEFHEREVNVHQITTLLEARGFHYFPSNTLFPNSMDLFLKT
jgi:FkbM family methyltransferase